MCYPGSQDKRIACNVKAFGCTDQYAKIYDRKSTAIFTVSDVTTANPERTQHERSLRLFFFLFFIYHRLNAHTPRRREKKSTKKTKTKRREKKQNKKPSRSVERRTERPEWKNIGLWLTVRPDDTA